MQAYGPYSASATGMFQVVLVVRWSDLLVRWEWHVERLPRWCKVFPPASKSLIYINIVTGCDHVCDSSDHLDAY